MGIVTLDKMLKYKNINTKDHKNNAIVRVFCQRDALHNCSDKFVLN